MTRTPRKKCLAPPRVRAPQVKNHLPTASIWVAERKLKFLTEHQGNSVSSCVSTYVKMASDCPLTPLPATATRSALSYARNYIVKMESKSFFWC